MSQENVEIVRRVYEAWNRDDLDAVLLLIHPNFELRQPPDLFLGVESVYRGHAGLRQWWGAVKEPWASLKSHIERTLDEGDAVVSVVQLEGVGRESGAKVALPSFANAWRLRSRLVVNLTAYYSLEEALEAVRLRE
jgi:ketosteroid isomerase-like protein